MNAYLALILLGVIQGLTEFLPVSSDGHLALAERFFGLTEGNLAITVALHGGTLLATLLYFRKDIARLIVAVPEVLKGNALPERRMMIAIVVGSVPTAIIGFGLKHIAESLTASLLAIGIFELISGAWDHVVVWRAKHGGGTRDASSLGILDAIAIGVVQGSAVLPGLSRSASTIGLASGLGFTREFAARFSFLLSLPAVGGALLLEAKDIRGLPAAQLPAVALGALVSFGVGLGALAILFAVLRQNRYRWFAYYCYALGAVVIALSLKG